MKEKQVYEKEKMKGKFREKAWKLLKVTLCLLFMVTVFTVPDISAKAEGFTVEPYSGVYDGYSHTIFDVCNSSGNSVFGSNMYTVWYKKSTETNYSQFWLNLAKAKDVSDSATYSVIVTRSSITRVEDGFLQTAERLSAQRLRLRMTPVVF